MDALFLKKTLTLSLVGLVASTSNPYDITCSASSLGVLTTRSWRNSNARYVTLQIDCLRRAFTALYPYMAPALRPPARLSLFR